MVSSLLFALLGRTMMSPLAVVADAREWEEPVSVELMPGYHPMLWMPTSSTFIFSSPDYIAEGHYVISGDDYNFRPETAIQLNHADVDKLTQGLDGGAAAQKQAAYARSIQPFDGHFDDSRNALMLHYPINGQVGTYELHSYMEGDDQLPPSVSEAARGFVGLWQAPEPFPERLDSKTRFRIDGIDGLMQFSKEGSASDAAKFSLMDLRIDHSFRNHATIGDWRVEGSKLILVVNGGESVLLISEDKRKLLAPDGQVVYVRA